MNYSFKSFVENKTTVAEGNEFSIALKKAKEEGKKEFEVEGKTYKVEEAEDDKKEEPKAPKLMSFDEFVKDKSTTDKSDDESGEEVAADAEVDAKLPSEDKEETDSDDKEEDKEKEDLEDKEAKDDAKGEEEEEEEEETDLDDLDI